METKIFNLIKTHKFNELEEILLSPKIKNLNFHDGFWKPMDSLKDKMDLNELWNADKADWKIWK